MTLSQLNVAVQRELSRMEGDETMMERTLRSLRRIRRERKAELEERQGDPEEEIAASLREAFKELKLIQEGKAEGRAVEELFNELQD